MNSVSAEIAAFITSTLPPRRKLAGTDQPLFSSGLLDSLGHVRLLAFIEKHFSVTIRLDEITLENFDTVDRIAAFVAAKKGE